MAGRIYSVYDSDRNEGMGVFYPVSNEMAESKDMEKSVRGLDGYIGICGGGTQNISILSRLSRHNDLEKIVLVDRNYDQLENFRKVSEIFNSSEDSKAYREKLKKHFLSSKGYLSRYSSTVIDSMEKPVLKDDTVVKLVNSDIYSYLGKKKKAGSYAIYMSNAIRIPADLKYTLNALSADDEIKDGSILILADQTLKNYYLLKKEGRRFATF